MNKSTLVNPWSLGKILLVDFLRPYSFFQRIFSFCVQKFRCAYTFVQGTQCFLLQLGNDGRPRPCSTSGPGWDGSSDISGWLRTTAEQICPVCSGETAICRGWDILSRHKTSEECRVVGLKSLCKFSCRKASQNGCRRRWRWNLQTGKGIRSLILTTRAATIPVFLQSSLRLVQILFNHTYWPWI